MLRPQSSREKKIILLIPVSNLTKLFNEQSYCTDHGHGTRIMPEGTITSLQFMRTSAYIQVAGQFNQTGVGLDPTDYGVRKSLCSRRIVTLMSFNLTGRT